MGECKYCGKPAGFLRSCHDECEKKHIAEEQKKLLFDAAAAPVAGLVALLRWLHGKKPTAVELFNNGTVRVYLDKDYYETEQRTIELYRCYKLRQALEAAITKPLEKEGIDTFAVETTNGRFFEVGKDTAPWFRAPEPETEDMGESEYETNLQLVSLSFREDNKWRFYDGMLTFYATMEDQEFLGTINNNETSFAKGDLLRVKVTRHQWLDGENLKTEYKITRVLEHRRASVQMRLPFTPGKP